jgi:hypothetical protein
VRFDEVPHRVVNEPAPGAFGRHAVKHCHGLIGKDDVDALAHCCCVVATLAVYTPLLWMSNAMIGAEQLPN